MTNDKSPIDAAVDEAYEAWERMPEAGSDEIRAALHIAINAYRVKVGEGWRPIETAPKDGADIIVFISSAPISNRFGCAQWCAKSHAWLGGRLKETGEDLEISFPPTHWMPMPESPKS